MNTKRTRTIRTIAKLTDHIANLKNQIGIRDAATARREQAIRALKESNKSLQRHLSHMDSELISSQDQVKALTLEIDMCSVLPPEG